MQGKKYTQCLSIYITPQNHKELIQVLLKETHSRQERVSMSDLVREALQEKFLLSK